MLQRWMQGMAAATPAQCEVCRSWPAAPLCSACLQQFATQRVRCPRCALALPHAGAPCGHCLREPPPLDACHAAVSYGYPWSGLIGSFKFHGQAGWAHAFAQLLRAVPGVAQELDDARWLLPMPLAPARLRERGFNQAAELARQLAPAKLDTGLAVRLQDTPAQAGLDRATRLRNVAQAFALAPERAAEVRGHAVLLVDDVMTSGASLFALARVLRAAGAARVSALVLARTEDD